MTPLRAWIGEPGLIALRVVQLLLVSGQLFLLVSVLRQRRRGAFALGLAAHLLCGFLVLLPLMERPAELGSCSPGWRALVEAFLALPWGAVAAAQAVSVALLTLSGRACHRWADEHLSESAVKETLDLLPAGVCVAEGSGVPVLTNLRMNEYCLALTGEPLADERAFWERLGERGEERGHQRLAACADGRMLLFARNTMRVDGREYSQLSAVDVTEKYRITAELKEKNEKLRELQGRCRALSVQASDMVFAQERLSARVAVHDELGQVLLLCRYFFDHPENTNQEMLYRMLQQTNTCFLRDVGETDEAEDQYAAAVRMAGEIGVRVETEGEPPASGEAREILGRAVRECAFNAAKHAEADCLRVAIGRREGRVRAEFTNNGLPPRGPVRESGGLLSLRRMVEGAGGRMEVEGGPAFRVRLEI